MAAKNKKRYCCYQVELVSEDKESPVLDSFWMYRIYSKKKKALRAAKIMRSFFPFNAYKAKVIVEKYENGQVIKKFKLYNEDGTR